jgi:replicative DNA helicase
LEEGWRIGATGLSTGFQELDEMLGGLSGGQLIVLGASPSVGKTALALNISCHQVRRKIPCAFFSLEMTGEEIAARMASEQSGIPLRSAAKGLDQEDSGRYGTAMKQVNAWPFWICDESGITVSQIRSRARRFKAEHKVELLVVDYIGLVEPGIRTDTRNDAVAYVSRNFKAMAKELNVPVLILAQLSREHKKAQRRPTLHDLRESGAIEADADKIMMLYPQKSDGRIVEVLVEKNRNGARGRIELEFDAPIFRFQQPK